MAELLFIQPSDITKTTVLGGNVDIDKYQFCIVNAQLPMKLSGMLASSFLSLFRAFIKKYI